MNKLVLLPFILLVSSFAHSDALSKFIPNAYIEVALQQDIPPTVFYVLALVESGKTIQKGVKRPWPWTLNVDGQGHYYSNKSETVAAFNKYMSQGAKNIDVGFMQVNWQINGRRYFSSIEEALEPYRNLTVGADILKKCYERKKDWYKAVGCYRSNTERYAQEHRDRFAERLTNLLVSTANDL